MVLAVMLLSAHRNGECPGGGEDRGSGKSGSLKNNGSTPFVV